MSITVETLVRATPQLVWTAWTTPEHICQWNAASDDWHTTDSAVDLRVGGRFSARMEARDGSVGFDFSGCYTEVDAPRRLVYVLDDDRRVIVSFEPAAAGGVRVRETFDPDDELPLDIQRAGWQAILDRFTAYVEDLA